MSEGILERIEAKLDKLLAGGGAAPAVKEKPVKEKPAKPAKPDFTAEQLRDKFLAVQKKHGDAVTKELIAECGYEKLAMLVADTDKWQASWDAAEAKLAEDAAADDDGGL